MKLRTLHRYVAIVMSPFLLLLALTGCLLFFRKTGWYQEEVKDLLVGLHTWEIVAPYIGLFVGAGLLFLTISGLILFFNRRA